MVDFDVLGSHTPQTAVSGGCCTILCYMQSSGGPQGDKSAQCGHRVGAWRCGWSRESGACGERDGEKA